MSQPLLVNEEASIEKGDLPWNADSIDLGDIQAEKMLLATAVDSNRLAGRLVFAMGSILFKYGENLIYDDLSLSKYHLCFLFLFVGIGSAVGGFVHDMMPPYAVVRYLFYGIITGCIVLSLSFALIQQEWIKVLGIIIFGFSSGLSYPLAMASNNAANSKRESQVRLAMAYFMQGAGYVWVVFVTNTANAVVKMFHWEQCEQYFLLLFTVALPLLVVLRLGGGNRFIWSKQCFGGMLTSSAEKQRAFQLNILTQLKPAQSFARIKLGLRRHARTLLELSVLWGFYDMLKYGTDMTSNGVIFAGVESDKIADTENISIIIFVAGVLLGGRILSSFDLKYVVIAGGLVMSILFLVQILLLPTPPDYKSDHVGTTLRCLKVVFLYGSVGSISFILAAQLSPKHLIGSFSGIAAFGGKVGAVGARLIMVSLDSGVQEKGREILGLVSIVVFSLLGYMILWKTQKNDKSVHLGFEPPRNLSLTFTASVKRDDFIVPMENLELGRVAASGSSGKVRKGLFSGNKVAIKEVYETYEGCLKTFNEEASVMAKLQHPAVARFFGAASEVNTESNTKSYYLITEWCDGGTVYDAIHSGIPSFETKLRWSWNICEALWYFHNRREPIAHFDVKPQNIMLTSKNYNSDAEIRICDLGEARVLKSAYGNRIKLEEEVGTIPYFPPEMMDLYVANPRKSKHVDFHELDATKVDTFCAGLVIMFIFTGLQPYETFRGSVQGILEYALGSGRPGHYDFDSVPSNIAAIVNDMVHFNPDKRPKMLDAARAFKRLVVNTSGAVPSIYTTA